MTRCRPSRVSGQGTSDPPAGMWLVIRQHDVEQATPGPPKGLPDRRQIEEVSADRVARSADLRVHQREYRVRTEAEPDGRVVQALLDLSRDHAVRSGLTLAFAITGLVGLLLTAAAGTSAKR